MNKDELLKSEQAHIGFEDEDIMLRTPSIVISKMLAKWELDYDISVHPGHELGHGEK